MFDTIWAREGGGAHPKINMLFNRYNYPLTEREINVCAHTGQILYTSFRCRIKSKIYLYKLIS